MSLTHTWERPLLNLAHVAIASAAGGAFSLDYDSEELRQAYAYCETLTAHHSRSFHLSSALLPEPKRRAARALYAFCRITDDIVDNPVRINGQPAGQQEIYHRLQSWKEQAFSLNPRGDDAAVVAWSDARSRFNIPIRYGEQLIDGVMRDLTKSRYQTFDELAAYAYGVASTVGLMSMHIIGYSGAEAIPYAIKLGVALQITNILRDVGEDWKNGRLYLPLEELAEFGLGEEDIAAGRIDNRWRAFMRFQIGRNRRLYAEAWSGIGCLSPDGRFAIAAAADLYRGILENIEANDYDVFNRRAYLSRWGKLRRLPRIWWISRRHYLNTL